MTPSWEPFRIACAGERPDAPRSIDTAAGVGDRLRAAAFAELQAREAFLWAATHFEDSPEALRGSWRRLAGEEQRHLDWLLKRMVELEIDVRERKVSDQLWLSLTSCKSAREFAHFMSSAEERGRKAGDRFREALRTKDPVTGGIFGRIADEEVSHIALAYEFFPA